jgi:hypothetical protein
MKKAYKFNDIVRQVDSLNDSPFKNIKNSIGLVVQKIAIIEDKCVINEEEVNKRFGESVRDLLPKDENNDPSSNEVVSYLNEDANEENNNLDLDDINDNNDIENKLFSRIFKMLALKCHPDKTDDEFKHKIFIFANESKKDLDIVKILYLLSKTDIEDFALNDDEINYINSKIMELDEYMNHISNSIFYKWDQLNSNQQDIILNNLKKINNFSNKN